ncbi:MAG: GspD family T2SS secretin variant LspD [Proteobacteria bacterium]|nr:GspD family T2SS secretin variant LspD [Pseudomonadota bacterium]
MRKYAFYLLAFLYATTSYSLDVTIKNQTADGKPTYLLQVGPFAQGNNALQLKFKLSSDIHEPINIEKPDNQKSYFVNIGPYHNYLAAREIQNKLRAEVNGQLPSEPIISNAEAKEEDFSNEPQNDESQNGMPSLDSTPPQLNGKIWNLRGADIRAVIDEVSRITGKSFIVDPRVQGKISIVATKPMSDKELYQVFLSMLQVSGYAAIPSGRIIKIVPNIDAKTMSPDLLNEMKNPPQGDDMMVAVIPVHYVPADQLVPVLRPLMPQWSSVSAYGPSNMLILSGRASNIKQMARIIRQVDSSSSSGIDMVHLRYALAMDVAATLKDLVKVQPGASVHSQTTIAADDRSNAILVSGNKTERIRLRLLINQLDKQSLNGRDSNTQVVYLNYLRAQDLVPILAGIAQANFSGNVGTTVGTITRPELDSTNPASNLANGTSSTNNNNNGYFTPAQSTPRPDTNSLNTVEVSTKNEGTTKPNIQIIAEPNTNSVIINAPASLIRILKSVISQLDIKPAQLLIEALVAEVNESDVKSLGIEWGTQAQTKSAANFRPGFAILNSHTSLKDFQAQIYALATQQKANILSTPSVVVLDNRQAKILVGKQVSVASTTYPNNAGGTTTASPYVTFDRVNVALHLYVRPQITRGRGIQLQIDQGNDTIDPASNLNTTNPTFDISSIVTSVHVDSGDIVVLGGLIQNSLGDNNNKLPVLGDIPAVGKLFQHNINHYEKRVLMVFIRPQILRTERDNLNVTGSKYNDIRRYELDWLRPEPFNEGNKDMILPALSQPDLPRPFSRPPKEVVLMTK